MSPTKIYRHRGDNNRAYFQKLKYQSYLKMSNIICSPCLIFLKGNYFQNESINFYAQKWPYMMILVGDLKKRKLSHKFLLFGYYSRVFCDKDSKFDID